ncbi:MAG: hypothetical protein E7388_01100 [Ruminococcaceae bacterium]|nr:hypothetical protein [Oscillospiraceae bacterium]
MNFLRRFMYGRYGADQLNLALIITSLLFTIISNILNIFFDVSWIIFINWIPLAWFIFRFLSKNIQKRRIENDKFLKFWFPVQSKLNLNKEKFRNRKTYKYLKCPNCKTNLRVPRLGGKKITINCNKCKTEFTTRA